MWRCRWSTCELLSVDARSVGTRRDELSSTWRNPIQVIRQFASNDSESSLTAGCGIPVCKYEAVSRVQRVRRENKKDALELRPAVPLPKHVGLSNSLHVPHYTHRVSSRVLQLNRSHSRIATSFRLSDLTFANPARQFPELIQPHRRLTDVLHRRQEHVDGGSRRSVCE